MLALVGASRFVGAYRCLDARDRKKALEFALQIGSARRIATSARMPGGALVAAYKDMFSKFRHENLQYESSSPMSLLQ